jgi:large subunit ribosomal protein L19
MFLLNLKKRLQFLLYCVIISCNLSGGNKMNLIDVIEKENIKDNIPEFSIGDTVKVYYKIKEGNKERIQGYEGVVIARRNGSIRESFTVRHMSFGVGVERTFPLHSPKIDKVEVLKKGKVRRAKLFYLRDLTGKATKIKEAR